MTSHTAAHPEGCDCDHCHGTPPTRTTLDSLALGIRIAEMFAPIGERSAYADKPSAAVAALIEHAKQEEAWLVAAGAAAAAALLDQARRRENAKPGVARRCPDVTPTRLAEFRADYFASTGKHYGWVKAAAAAFGLTPKTIKSRMPKE